MLLFKGENGMSEHHTDTYNVHVIKYTDSLYVRSAHENGITLVPNRKMANEYNESELYQIKDDVKRMIKLGLNKDSIFVVEESEMVVKKFIEKTVDTFINEPALDTKIDLANVSQNVWDKM